MAESSSVGSSVKGLVIAAISIAVVVGVAAWAWQKGSKLGTS